MRIDIFMQFDVMFGATVFLLLYFAYIAFSDFSERIGVDRDRKGYDLTSSERYILQLIYDGCNFLEIADELNISIDDLHIAISLLMKKRQINTWHQLTAFAWHIVSLERQNTLGLEITQDCEEITKGHIEGFCDLYEMLINDHKKTCTTCLIGYSYMCNEHRRLQTLKKDWMDKLISNKETKL